MIYLCPACGAWRATFGLLEAIFQPQPGTGVEVVYSCLECQSKMVRVYPDDRLVMKPTLIEEKRDES